MQAELKRRCVAIHREIVPGSRAEFRNALGGAAVFIEEGSPLTEVAAAGTEVPTTEAEIQAVEEFMEERGAPVVFKLCPFADAALFTMLSQRGYEIGEFENVLVRRVGPEDGQGRDEAVGQAEEELVWAKGLAEGFFDMVTPMGIELGQIMFRYPESVPVVVMGGVTESGAREAAAASTVILDGELALLACDATVRRYREAGLHKRMIRHRLALAAERGCTMATAETLPGSISQMNFEKCGFQVAYTKLTLLRP